MTRSELLESMVRAAGWSSQVARRAHNPKVAGSNPAPATPESRSVERLSTSRRATSGPGSSERRIPREFQDPPCERPQDLALNARVLVEHLPEVLGRQYEEPQRRLRRDGGGAGRRLEQRDLPDEVARAKRRHTPALRCDLDAALY